MARAHGIDVNHFHPVLDWNQLAGAGFDFFGAKATNGMGVDARFIDHRDGARQLPFEAVLYYHFPTPRSPAKDQALRFVERVGPLRPNERLALDVELDKETKWCPDVAFIDAFVEQLPARSLVYVSARVWHELVGAPSWPNAILTDAWLAHYGDDAPALPADAAGYPIWPKWTFWQDSDKYQAPGVDGPCDHDFFNGDRDALAAYMRAGAGG
jgi:GH25 family lysozyme M1 (1,4-beta-N-acetylmuramidase)